MTDNELRAEIQRLESKIAPLNDRLVELRLKLRESLSLFKIGDVIETTSGQARRGRVTAVCKWVDTFSWKVQVIRKDGTEGCQQMFYPYQLPRLVKRGGQRTAE